MYCYKRIHALENQHLIIIMVFKAHTNEYLIHVHVCTYRYFLRKASHLHQQDEKNHQC